MNTNNNIDFDFISKQLNSMLKIKHVKIKLLNNLAKIPTKANPEDAGWDLYSTIKTIIPAGGRLLINTGISIEIPNGYVGLIWPRSGLSIKNGADILAGVIDSCYRGEIKVCINNCDSLYDIKIEEGDRIAQILFQEIPKFELIEAQELSETNRGNKGFGSSGN